MGRRVKINREDRKRRIISRILDNPVYLSCSGLYEKVSRALLRLPEDVLEDLESSSSNTRKEN